MFIFFPATQFSAYLDLHGGFFVGLQNYNTSKKEHLSKDEIKDELLSSMVDSENGETQDLNEKADKEEKCDMLRSSFN